MNKEFYKSKFENIVYGNGIRHCRSIDQANELKWFIEEAMTLKPTLFITVTLLRRQRLDTVIDTLGGLVAKYSWKLGEHCLPIVSYNADRFGWIKNDIHIILLTESNKATQHKLKLIAFHKTSKHRKAEGQKTFQFTDFKIIEYNSDLNGVGYVTLRHKELGIVMGCPRRHNGCKSKKGKPRRCYYTTDITRLLNIEAIDNRYGLGKLKVVPAI